MVGAAATVWLVGMMGAGKTVVGRALAARLDLPFADTDAEVERTSGSSIPEIFAREGEARFRELERRAIEAWAGRRAVVALGGGAMAQEGVPELLTRHGPVFYLRASPETLASRVGSGSGRPLLADSGARERLRRLEGLAAAREPHYARATWTIETDACSVTQVVDEIVARLGEGDP